MKNIKLVTLVGIIICVGVIMFLSVYLNSRKKLSEMFIDKADTAYEDTIISLTRTHLFRAPSQSEIAAFTKVMRNPNDSSRVLREIKKSDEYKSLKKASVKSHSGILAPNIPLQSEFNITDKRVDELPIPLKTEYYRKIIALYDRILFRMPTMQELNYYTARMISDKAFNEKKLQVLIESSREFDILQKNQNNQVFCELSSGMTDAQIEYEVEEIYKQAVGIGGEKTEKIKENRMYMGLGDGEARDYENGDQMMSTSMFDFLKQKYKEYELDEKRLFDLIVMIRNLDKNNVSMDMIINHEARDKKTNTDLSSEHFEDTEGQDRKNERFNEEEEEKAKNEQTQNNTVEGIVADTEKEIRGLQVDLESEEEKAKSGESTWTNDNGTNITDLFQKRADMILNRGRALALQKNKDMQKSADIFNRLSEEISDTIRKKSEHIIRMHLGERNETMETDPNLEDITLDPLKGVDDLLDTAAHKTKRVQKKISDPYIKEHKKKTKLKKKRRACGLRSTQYKGVNEPVSHGGTEAKKNDKHSADIPYSSHLKLYEHAKYPSSMFTYEPYNICNVSPFSVMHNKTRDVYDKKRNGLAYAQNNRNLAEMKDRCARQTKFLNATDDMVLFPEYKWSVPQARAPVCELKGEYKYEPLMAQTALIGTLLDDI